MRKGEKTKVNGVEGEVTSVTSRPDGGQEVTVRLEGKALRKAEHDAAKASRKSDKDTRKSERDAAKATRKSERDAAKAARPRDDEDTAPAAPESPAAASPAPLAVPEDTPVSMAPAGLSADQVEHVAEVEEVQSENEHSDDTVPTMALKELGESTEDKE